METNQVNKHLDSVKDDLLQAVRKDEGRNLSFSKESPLFCPCNFSIVKQETSNSCVKPANKSSFSFKRLFTLFIFFVYCSV
jgi:hypothetical protein